MLLRAITPLAGTAASMRSALICTPTAASSASRTLRARRNMATVTKFTKTHEYVRYDEDSKVGVVGISDFAQSKLGDVVFLDLPAVGASFKQGDSFGSVESVKAASDVYLPVSGKIVERNEAIVEKPQLVNESAMGDGWFVKIKVDDPKQISTLLDAKEYEKVCQEE